MKKQILKLVILISFVSGVAEAQSDTRDRSTPVKNTDQNYDRRDRDQSDMQYNKQDTIRMRQNNQETGVKSNTDMYNKNSGTNTGTGTDRNNSGIKQNTGTDKTNSGAKQNPPKGRSDSRYNTNSGKSPDRDTLR